MSIQPALHFIEQVRRDETLQQAIAALGDDMTLDDIVAVAAAAGFTFTADDLERAHKHDWAMRWTRYNPRATGR